MITRKFSSFATKKRGDGWLELCYEVGDGDAIRAVMSLKPDALMPAAGSPPGTQAADAIPLQGLGVTSLLCPDKECSGGPPPLQQAPVPDQIPFCIELPAGAVITTMEGGQSCLIVRGRNGTVVIPVLDGSLVTDEALSGALKPYRNGLEDDHCMDLKCVAFHVYRIAVAPDPLAALRGKRIALAIPSECVQAVASTEVAIAASTGGVGSGESAANDEVPAGPADEQISALA